MRRIRDADAIEDEREVVGHNRVARPLGGDGNQGRNEKSAAIRRAGQHLLDGRSLLRVGLGSYSFPNLSNLMDHELRVFITGGMVLDQQRTCFFVPAFGDEVSVQEDSQMKEFKYDNGYNYTPR